MSLRLHIYSPLCAFTMSGMASYLTVLYRSIAEVKGVVLHKLGSWDSNSPPPHYLCFFQNARSMPHSFTLFLWPTFRWFHSSARRRQKIPGLNRSGEWLGHEEKEAVAHCIADWAWAKKANIYFKGGKLQALGITLLSSHEVQAIKSGRKWPLTIGQFCPLHAPFLLGWGWEREWKSLL